MGFSLQATDYNRLRGEAARWGGVDSGAFWHWSTRSSPGVPMCAFGLAMSADGYDGPLNYQTPLFAALVDAGLRIRASDDAVWRIRQRHGWLAQQRVPFDEWAAEVGLTCDPTLTETPNES